MSDEMFWGVVVGILGVIGLCTAKFRWGLGKCPKRFKFHSTKSNDLMVSCFLFVLSS
jgi:hypothetical protein